VTEIADFERGGGISAWHWGEPGMRQPRLEISDWVLEKENYGGWQKVRRKGKLGRVWGFAGGEPLTSLAEAPASENNPTSENGFDRTGLKAGLSLTSSVNGWEKLMRHLDLTRKSKTKIVLFIMTAKTKT
jgi:hypothetical protein